MTNEEIENAAKAWCIANDYYYSIDRNGEGAIEEVPSDDGVEAFTAGAHFYRDEMAKMDDGFDEWEQMEEWHDVLVLDATDTEAQTLALYQAARAPLLARIAHLEARLQALTNN